MNVLMFASLKLVPFPPSLHTYFFECEAQVECQHVKLYHDRFSAKPRVPYMKYIWEKKTISLSDTVKLIPLKLFLVQCALSKGLGLVFFLVVLSVNPNCLVRKYVLNDFCQYELRETDRDRQRPNEELKREWMSLVKSFLSCSTKKF